MPIHAARRGDAAFTRWARAAAGVLVALASPATAQSLDDRVNTIVGRAALGGAKVGVCVVEIDTGRTIASHRADRPMIPASNMKLLTSGAALITLGPDFTFRTELSLHEEGGVSRLVLVGSGDPALGDPVLLDQGAPALTIHDLLSRIGSAVSRRGVQRVDELVIDDRLFDNERAHPSWPADQLNRWYCAEVSGINLHTNVITVFARAASGPPSVTIEPEAPWVSVSNKARSIDKGQPTAWVARPRPANDFTLYGDVRSRVAIPAAVADPADFAGRVLAAALQRQGVEVPAAPRRPAPGEEFRGATPLVAVTTTIEDVLRRCNSDSHNLYAEALFKRMGHELSGEPGSWSNAAAALRVLLNDRLGPEHALAVQAADGSGMSRDNLVPPATLTAWLAHMAKDSATADTYLRSLAVPGEGTLRSRFRGGTLSADLHAKSGYLRGVYSLSGYLVDPRTGEPEVAFSIILNDVPEGAAARNAKPLHEDIVEAIDAWLADQSPVASVPTLGG